MLRYWSKTVLDHLHRKMAIRQWQELTAKPDSGNRDQLERSLGAFDLFLIDEKRGDLDDVRKRSPLSSSSNSS